MALGGDRVRCCWRCQSESPARRVGRERKGRYKRICAVNELVCGVWAEAGGFLGDSGEENRDLTKDVCLTCVSGLG